MCLQRLIFLLSHSGWHCDYSSASIQMPQTFLYWRARWADWLRTSTDHWGSYWWLRPQHPVRNPTPQGIVLLARRIADWLLLKSKGGSNRSSCDQTFELWSIKVWCKRGTGKVNLLHLWGPYKAREPFSWLLMSLRSLSAWEASHCLWWICALA